MALKARPGSEPPEPDDAKLYLIKANGTFYIAAMQFWMSMAGRVLHWESDDGWTWGVDEVAWWIPVEEIDKEVGA